MSDPRRIIDGDGTGLARSLVESASDETPSREAMTRALVAVAAGGAATAAAATAGAATAAQGVAASKASAALGAPVIALLKWLGIGAAGAALTVATVEVLDAGDHRELGAATTMVAPPATSARTDGVSPRVAPASSAADEERVSPVVAPGARPGTPPMVSRAAVRPAPAASGSSAPVAADGVYAEVDALDRARRSIAAGDSESALRTLGEYEQRFPRGQLGPEGLAMRMEAQLASGDQRGAIESARKLLSASPRSPHAGRARQIVSSGEIKSGRTED